MEEYESLSLRARRKKPSVCLSCCFNPGYHQRADSFDAASSSVMPSPSNHRLSPSSLKGRCKNLMSRMGRHRRHSSADFSYDPLSYSLNFQDNDDPSSDHYDHDFPVRSFASRLPLSPPGSRRNPITLIPPCSTTIRNSPIMVRPASQLGVTSSSQAAAVAEVRKSLEEEDHHVDQEHPPTLQPWDNKLEEMRSLDLPKTPRKLHTSIAIDAADMSSSTAAGRRNINLLTPTRMAPPDIVRRSYEYDQYEDVSPALVVSPTRRQVLVELC
ncbi:OLC1v1027947C1 [Oldenlandia corymbosa var. corymbosa]|uniref:OLC1v1027947C1 n=1 Tax=Oldenlandia corymbosa var. corymbosa TaxID=529605 RepID=A0AAV1CBR2_OLDCO|nr:OLC1v1027947C1 [Oldenlandia corymbosa var. corymbosa]